MNTKNLLKSYKWLYSCIFIVLFSGSFSAYASITAVVIKTNFKPGNWQPLPEDKIKSAAVDTALSEISSTKRFAFFTSPPVDIKTGTLIISIKLIEAAETATVSIQLNQVNGASLSSTHSESLKNKNYDGIYRQFQKAGMLAGKKIVKIIQSQPISTRPPKLPVEDQKRILYLENQINNINHKIINKPSNNNLRNEAKLEFILDELKSIKNSYADLAKKEDIRKQGIKIDQVLDEVGKINKRIDDKPSTQINVNQSYILENALSGQNSIPNTAPGGDNDALAKQLYNDAQELKRSEKYSAAEIKLQQAIKLNISSDLRSLIYDELIYSLPMYEAQAIAIKLGRNFQQYNKSGKDKSMLNRVSYLYKTALKNNQNNFQRTRQIQGMLDQHYSTRQAMSAVISVQQKMNIKTIHYSLYQQLAMRGEYPDIKDLKSVIKQAGFHYKILSYRVLKDTYTAKFQTPAGEVIKFSSNESGHVSFD